MNNSVKNGAVKVNVSNTKVLKEAEAWLNAIYIEDVMAGSGVVHDGVEAEREVAQLVPLTNAFGRPYIRYMLCRTRVFDKTDAAPEGTALCKTSLLDTRSGRTGRTGRGTAPVASRSRAVSPTEPVDVP
ncbi:hypothetical protein EVAR_102359_1 [Eumeta japonica]|uniref:Uncharacterized protein n=1 Tax=Eumeta variegata TaxID=151549 RepID=A0A4C1XLU6_EUMVA|nr:hypothetical protein EVAR_102359_1 [Eumeta japonica]